MIRNKIYNFLFFIFLIGLNQSLYAEQIEQEDESVIQQLSSESLIGEDIQTKKNDEICENIDEKIELLLSEQEKEINEDKDEDSSDNQILLDFFLQPTKMAEKLPENYREDVIEVWEACQHAFANMQNPIMFLFDMTQNLVFKLDELSINDSQKESKNFFLEVLNKVQNILKSQNFMMALQFGVFNEQFKKELEDLINDLNKILELDFLFKNLDDKEEIKNNLKIMQKSFEFLKQKDLNSFINCKNEYFEPKLIKVFTKLQEVQIRLDELEKSLDDSKNNKEVKKAIKFWKEALEGFSFLKNSNGGMFSDLEGFGSKWMERLEKITKISPLVEGGYVFYRKFIDLYNLDSENKENKFEFSLKNIKNPKMLMSLLADQALRLSIMPIYFLKRMVELKNANINPLLKEFSFQQILGEVWGMYWDSNFYVRNQIWPLRAFYRLGPAFSYFKSRDFYNYFAKGKEWGNKNICPNTKNKFKEALWFSMKDGYRSLTSVFESEICNKIDPKVLSKIENKSLGLIKPELLRFILDTSLPILTYNKFPKNVANFVAKDVFKNEFYGQDYWDWNYIGKRNFSDIKISKNFDEKEFIEGRILGYIVTNLGSYAGKTFASRYKNSIKYLLSKSGNGISKVLVKMGIMSQESIAWFDETKNDLKFLVKELLSGTDDPIMIMARQMFFPMLIQNELLSQLDVAFFEEKVKSRQLDEEELDKFVDKIFSNITDKIVIWTGGIVGFFSSWIISDQLVKNYGPFYPKAQNYIQNLG